jgi:hypothetical protein
VVTAGWRGHFWVHDGRPAEERHGLLTKTQPFPSFARSAPRAIADSLPGTRLALKYPMTQKSVGGSWLGALLAPFTSSISWLRQARMFHPCGLTCRAELQVATSDADALCVAQRLVPTALMRWSSAWWKRWEWMDALGVALRFTTSPLSSDASDGDQDLLFATIRRPWTLPLAPLTTRQHDFLANDYYTVSPFAAEPLGRIEFRLRSEAGVPLPGATRTERWLAAVADRRTLVLEWAPYRKAWQAFDGRSFRPLVRLVMTEIIELDQERLRFDPFRAGRGIEPVGWIHDARRATYAASQRARALRSARRQEPSSSDGISMPEATASRMVASKSANSTSFGGR